MLFSRYYHCINAVRIFRVECKISGHLVPDSQPREPSFRLGGSAPGYTCREKRVGVRGRVGVRVWVRVRVSVRVRVRVRVAVKLGSCAD